MFTHMGSIMLPGVSHFHAPLSGVPEGSGGLGQGESAQPVCSILLWIHKAWSEDGSCIVWITTQCSEMCEVLKVLICAKFDAEATVQTSIAG